MNNGICTALITMCIVNHIRLAICVATSFVERQLICGRTICMREMRQSNALQSNAAHIGKIRNYCNCPCSTNFLACTLALYTTIYLYNSETLTIVVTASGSVTSNFLFPYLVIMAVNLCIFATSLLQVRPH